MAACRQLTDAVAITWALALQPGYIAVKVAFCEGCSFVAFIVTFRGIKSLNFDSGCCGRTMALSMAVHLMLRINQRLTTSENPGF